jgi:PKHD-type hydroxylase
LFGFTEALQFTEYQAPDGHYAYHMDKVPHGTIRKLSIVVQLTDEDSYAGGDFEILDGTYPEKLPRTRGMLLMFPSYTMHKVNPVTDGIRNSLVGWISGNNFK